MFFAVSKFLGFLLDPFLWIVVGLVAGLFKNSRSLLVGSIILLLLLTNSWLSNMAMRYWETPAVLKEQIPLCDIGIVLTGMTHPEYLPEDQLHLSESSDRITEAIRLYHSGIINKLIVSGGSAQLISQDEPESEKLKALLLAAKVRERDIHLETTSRNTYENAFYTKKILQEIKLEDRKMLLITSSFHMTRAVGCYVKQGVEVIPYPVDFRSRKVDFNAEWIIPSVHALQNWKTLIKEWLGILIYKTIGYA